MREMPSVAWYLGFGGVIPFLCLSLMIVLDSFPIASPNIAWDLWLAIYAAVILSFLGAIHWGVILGIGDTLSTQKAQGLLIYSVLPALFAWFALLLPLAWALLAQSVLVVLAYGVDRRYLFPVLKSNYAHLRLYLSVIVAMLLLLASLTKF